jgi:DNA-binding LacI/PurR family transcriptional regulator
MALRGDPRTAEGTRLRVRQAATTLGYVPHSLGRGLRTRRMGSIALVIPHSGGHVVSHPYFLELLAGVAEVCTELDWMLQVSISRRELDEDTPYLRVIRSRAVDGVIVASAALEDRNVLQLWASGFPSVFIGRYPYDHRIDAIGVDDAGGAREATDHLIEVHGARRIAYLAGPANTISAVDRMEGYRTSLARHGIVYREDLVIHGDYDQASGERACRDLLSRDGFDAIMTGNDEMAIGALRVLRGAGIRVPEDVPLVGFDDLSAASIVTPPLTTVHQPVRELGAAAATRLISLIETPEQPASQVLLPVSLVVRRSCGCTGQDSPTGSAALQTR